MRSKFLLPWRTRDQIYRQDPNLATQAYRAKLNLYSFLSLIEKLGIRSRATTHEDVLVAQVTVLVAAIDAHYNKQYMAKMEIFAGQDDQV